MAITIDGTNGITSPGGDSSAVDVTTPKVKNAGTLSLEATGANVITFSNNGAESARFAPNGDFVVGAVTTSNSKMRIVRNNASNFGNAHLELESLAGNVALGFHALGSSAVSLKHGRGTGSLQVRNTDDTAFAAIQASAFTVGSDYRMKENIVPLVGAIDRLKQLPVHRFNFKPFDETGEDWGDRTVDGFLAHEAAEVVPEAVIGEKDAVKEDGSPFYQGIDQSKLVPLLTAAIQEQQTLIQALTARIEALEQA